MAMGVEVAPKAFRHRSQLQSAQPTQPGQAVICSEHSDRRPEEAGRTTMQNFAVLSQPSSSETFQQVNSSHLKIEPDLVLYLIINSKSCAV